MSRRNEVEDGRRGGRARGGTVRPGRQLGHAVLVAIASLGLSASAGDGARAAPADDLGRRAEVYYHLLRAGLALGQGRAAETALEVERAVEMDPTSAALRGEASGLLLLAGRRADAEREARRALELDASQPVALRVLGDLAAARALASRADTRSRDEAILHYERLLASGGADDQVLWTLARLKLQAGDGKGALEAARRYASRRPSDPSATRLLVELLVRNGHLEQALSEVARALETEQAGEDLLPLAGELARRTGSWAPVEAACRKRLESSPQEVSSRALRGEALFRLGRPRDAVAELEIVVAQAPSDPYPRLHLAMAYAAAGRFSDAVSLARGLAIEYPDNPTPKLVAAEVLARQGDLDGALEALGDALRASAGVEQEAAARRDEIRRRMASLELARSDVAGARRALDQLDRPDDVESLELRARVALASSRFAEARAAARMIREAGQAGRAALVEGEILAREARVGKARDRFAEAVRSMGSAAWGEVAEAWRRAGRDDQAEQALRRWVEAEPGGAHARFRLGAYLERVGRFPEAEAELRESLRLEPGDPEVLNYLGYSLADRNQSLGEALELILKAVALDPWNGAFLDSLGWVYYRLGRYAEAREPLERAARELPKDPTVLEHLGDVYHKLGDRARAADLWRRALELGRDKSDELRAKLAELEAASSRSPAEPRP